MSEDSGNGPHKGGVNSLDQPHVGSGKSKDYEIGYRKPPKATQFKKGQSGNPKGARKKKEVHDIRLTVEEVLAEPTTLTDGQRKLTVSKLESIFQSQRIKALKGNQRAVKALFKLAQKTSLFSQAKPKSNIILEPPGGDAEGQMIVRAYHDMRESQSTE